MAKASKVVKEPTSVDNYVKGLEKWGKTGAEPLKFVVMERDGKLADVHPSEVNNYKVGNWVVYQS